MKRLHIFLLTFFFICPTSNAADIWHKQSGRAIHIVVEGEIVPGDFDNLKSLLRDKSPAVWKELMHSQDILGLTTYL